MVMLGYLINHNGIKTSLNYFLHNILLNNYFANYVYYLILSMRRYICSISLAGVSRCAFNTGSLLTMSVNMAKTFPGLPADLASQYLLEGQCTVTHSKGYTQHNI